MTAVPKSRDKNRLMETLYQQAVLFPQQEAKENVLWGAIRVKAPLTQLPDDLIIATRGQNTPESESLPISTGRRSYVGSGATAAWGPGSTLQRGSCRAPSLHMGSLHR